MMSTSFRAALSAFFVAGALGLASISAAQAESRYTDNQTKQHCHERAGKKSQDNGSAADPQRTRDQRTESEECRVPEIDLAGIATQQIPTLREDNGEKNLHAKIQ